MSDLDDMPSNAFLIEAIARQLCAADRVDPDEEIIGGQATAFTNYGPRWRCPGYTGIFYYQRAESILTRLQQSNAGKDREIAALNQHITAVRDALGVSEFASRPLSCYVTDLQQSNAALVEALNAIADFGNVNLAGEWEHALRDIIRSMTDCAKSALANA